MNFHLSSYGLAYLFNALPAGILAYIVWRRGAAPGRIPFFWLLLAVGVWSDLRGLRIGFTSITTKILCARIEYIVIPCVAVLWLIFALEYTQQTKWLVPKTLVWLWVIPVATAIVTITQTWDGLLFREVAPEPDLMGDIVVTHGVWFWVVMGYTYLIAILGTYILVRTTLRYARLYRIQITILVLGSLVLLASSLAHIAGFRPIHGLDLIPFGVTIGYLIYGLNILRFGLLSLVPVARETIIEHMRDGVLVLDQRKRIVDINPAAHELIGLADSVVGQNIETALARWPGLVMLLSQGLETQTEYRLEGETPRWLDLQATPLLDWRGKPTGRLITLRDITKRKSVEEELRQSEERFHTLVVSMEDVIFTLDREGRYTGIFGRWLERTGSTPETFIGHTAQEVFGEDTAGALKEATQRALQGEHVVHEWSLPTPDGVQYYQTSLSPIRNAEGIVGLVGVGRDITILKRAEEALRASEQRLTRLLETVPDGITIVNRRGQITFANPAAENILGLTLDEITGRNYNAPDWKITTVDGQPLPEAELPFKRVMQSGQPVYNIEHAIEHPNGKRVILSVNAAPLHDPSGNVDGMISAIVDITGRKRVEETLARNAREMRTLYETSLAINSQPDLPTLLNTIVESAVGLLGANMGGLYLLEPDGEHLRLVISQNLPGNYVGTIIHVGEGMSGRVAQTGEPVMIEDYQLWAYKAKVFASLPIRRLLGIPLKQKGRVVGIINIGDHEKVGAFTPDEIRLATLFGDQAAIAVENARLLAETSRHANELAMLNHIGIAITSGLDMQHVLQALFEQCQQVAPIDCFYVSLYDESTNLLQIPFFAENGKFRTEPPRDLNDSSGLTGYVIQTRQSLYLPDTLDADNPPPVPMIRTGGTPSRTYIGVPLILRERVIGVLSIQSYQPNAYTREQIYIIETIAIHAAIAVENARLYSEVQRLAIVDELTGLYNFRGLFELGPREVERARRFGRPLTALFFDIDLFRNFNNRYSHATGNLVLRVVSQRSRSCVRSIDLVARYGGEEFVILLPEADLATAKQVAERLRRDIELTLVPTEWGMLGVTISIGVANFTAGTPDLAALVDRANQAEHIAKNTGRNRVVVVE